MKFRHLCCGGSLISPPQGKAGFFVRIPIRIIRPNLVPLQMLLGSTIKTVGKTVAGGLTRGSVAAPAGGDVPMAIGAGRIDMDGNEDHMVFAQAAAPGIDPADSLGERDVFKLGYQDLGIVAERLKAGHHGRRDFTGVLVFAKASVGTAFAGRVSAMTGIDEDFHRGGIV